VHEAKYWFRRWCINCKTIHTSLRWLQGSPTLSYGLTNRLAGGHITQQQLKLQQLVGHIRAIAAPAPPLNTDLASS
jgi:hypothetical protein